MGNPAGMRKKKREKRRNKLEARLYVRDLAASNAAAPAGTTPTPAAKS